jgi:RNA polymerase sigma-70 factor (ECF subfamily)
MVAILSRLHSPAAAAIPPVGPPARAVTSADEARYDARLVDRFNAGDLQAFDEIVARHHRKMFGVAFGHLRNHSDAEEIAQDVFVCAHRALGRFRGDSSLATWLHRIALNLSRNRYKHNFCRRRHAMLSLDCTLGGESDATFSDLIDSEAPSPARVAATGEFAELVSRCMARLGPSQREILVRRNELSQSYSVIARALNLSLGTVKSRIARARENLRELMAESYPELPPESSSLAWFESLRPRSRPAVARA